MGGTMSSSRDNDELVDNLVRAEYISSPLVEDVFRAVDRGDYLPRQSRGQAYRDNAWKSGPLHLSAPCIYSTAMEALELSKGMTFLNVGSGTGYFSTMVGLIIGTGGVNHGIEVDSTVLDYANERLTEFLDKSPGVDEMDFCEPKFVLGNGMELSSSQIRYDRVYCGGGCPPEYENYIKDLVKVGGILVFPLNDKLVRASRVEESRFLSRHLMHVAFTALRRPAETARLLRLEVAPATLQVQCRAAARRFVRVRLLSTRPELAAPPSPRPRLHPRVRRIRIPLPLAEHARHLDAFHDLQPETGSREMNALLGLVLTMGEEGTGAAVATGRIRFDSFFRADDGEDNDTPADVPPPTSGDLAESSRSSDSDAEAATERARRAAKRRRLRRPAAGDSSGRSEESSARSRRGRRRHKRPSGEHRARRLRLSAELLTRLHELPLPSPLLLYLTYGRSAPPPAAIPPAPTPSASTPAPPRTQAGEGT